MLGAAAVGGGHGHQPGPVTSANGHPRARRMKMDMHVSQHLQTTSNFLQAYNLPERDAAGYIFPFADPLKLALIFPVSASLNSLVMDVYLLEQLYGF